MFKALIIDVGGRLPEVREIASTDELGEAVGGYLATVQVPEAILKHAGGRVVGWINDNGKAEAPFNAEATKLLADSLFWGDYICGPLVLSGDDGEGGEADVPEPLVRAVLARWDHLKFPHPFGPDGDGIVLDG